MTGLVRIVQPERILREAPQEANQFIMSHVLREIINGLLNAADMQAPNAFYAALIA